MNAHSAGIDTIRVLLADDHDILRDGLKALLTMAGDICVVGEARTGREAVAEAERLRPDVVLMDITMPELDGVEATRRIRQTAPEVRVLFLTMHEAEEYFFRALRAGAAGYVIKRAAGWWTPSAEATWVLWAASLPAPRNLHTHLSGKSRLLPMWVYGSVGYSCT